MISVTFICRDGKKYIVEGKEGDTLLDLVQKNDISEIEGACEGCMACATCHVVVDKDWYMKLPIATDDENDMLDLAFGLTHTSRLGCQIIIDEKLDGMKVKVPTGTRNMSVE